MATVVSLNSDDKRLPIFCLLWLDANPNEGLDTEQKLRSTINYLKKFQDIDQCQQYIKRAEKMIVLLEKRSNEMIICCFQKYDKGEPPLSLVEGSISSSWSKTVDISKPPPNDTVTSFSEKTSDIKIVQPKLSKATDTDIENTQKSGTNDALKTLPAFDEFGLKIVSSDKNSLTVIGMIGSDCLHLSVLVFTHYMSMLDVNKKPALRQVRLLNFISMLHNLNYQ
ncbi:hypothetical protein I4U23_023040 [Adineta vaga]|nr:hypothetical protein I4U23_023040 [Adineta vaga]